MASYGRIIATVAKVIEWLPKIYKFFEPFKPEITQFQINCCNNNACIHYKLDIESSSIRRKIGKIEIPRLPYYKISSFYGEGFANLNELIKVSQNKNSYIIKTKDLPSCRYFQIVLSGLINEKALKELVRIQYISKWF